MPTSTDFLKPPFTHMDALTLPERSLRQDLSGFYDVTSAILTAVVSPAPRIFVAFRSVSPIPPQYAYTLLRSYYFSSTISSKSVVKSSERTIAISPSEAKPLPEAGFAPVRGLQASACFSSTFYSFDRSLSRCGAQTSFFLHTNSLINSSHVGDAF